MDADGAGANRADGDDTMRQSLPAGAKAVLIFLHGSGDTGSGLRRALGTLADGHLLQVLEAKGVHVLTPSARIRPYQLFGGAPASVWFDRTAYEPDAPEDTASIDESAARLVPLIAEAHEQRLPVIIGGFSMGGGMALHLACREAATHPLAGVFALSSYMCARSPALQLDGIGHMPPLYMRHGAADDFILPEWGQATARELESLGTDVSFALLPGVPHTMSDGEIVDLTDWIIAQLTKAGLQCE